MAVHRQRAAPDSERRNGQVARAAGVPYGCVVTNDPHHRHDANAIACAIVTISDTRSEQNDGSGQRIRDLLTGAGHRVALYKIVADEAQQIRAVLADLPDEVAVVLCNGGTGLARRDTTFETVVELLDKEIPGFGELFRMLSYEEIGAAAMLSRAVAGVLGERVVFCMPGSTKAVDLAMRQLIVPQLGHLVGLIRESE
jgi:molybdenum cofactor biosynthesis protein B